MLKGSLFTNLSEFQLYKEDYVLATSLSLISTIGDIYRRSDIEDLFRDWFLYLMKSQDFIHLSPRPKPGLFHLVPKSFELPEGFECLKDKFSFSDKIAYFKNPDVCVDSFYISCEVENKSRMHRKLTIDLHTHPDINFTSHSEKRNIDLFNI